MSDRIANPNRNIFSAMNHNTEPCVKKMNMNILNRCLESPFAVYM